MNSNRQEAGFSADKRSPAIFFFKNIHIKVEQINIPTESEWLNSESVLMSDPSSMPNVLVEYGGSRTAEYVKSNLIVKMDP